MDGNMAIDLSSFFLWCTLKVFTSYMSYIQGEYSRKNEM